ncbi:MAG: ABC transporter substrate-binding protein, partial [Treponema sp.]|nr:ABC transporter substrate-binding protein [Treponema sp.]
RKSFVEENKDLVEKVLKEVAAAIDYTNKNPEKAGQLVEKYSLGLKAPIVTKSIPTSAFAYSSAVDAKKDIEDLLSVFLDFAPESIGGKLPDDSFYFN